MIRLTGIWIAATAKAGRPIRTDEPYPCFCAMSPRSCHSVWCNCWGRPDPFTWAGCCGPTFTHERWQAAERQRALRGR